MLTAIVIALFAGTFIFDFLPKLKKQPGKNKAVYCALAGLSFIILILFSFNIWVPGPAEPIGNLIRSIFKVE